MIEDKEELTKKIKELLERLGDNPMRKGVAIPKAIKKKKEPWKRK